LSGFIKRKTQKLRNSIARKLASGIYENCKLYNDIITHTPRPMIIEAKTHFQNQTNLKAAEIGVAQADNSLSMLEALPLGKFWLIDPYAHVGAMADYALAKKKLATYQQVKWEIKTSSQAAKEIDEPLDLVYIDGSHDYEIVRDDIKLYYPLVKAGGMIGGHGYQNYWWGVIKAVDEFYEQNRLKLAVRPPDWWIIKP
jgi:hypothetical protein